MHFKSLTSQIAMVAFNTGYWGNWVRKDSLRYRATNLVTLVPLRIYINYPTYFSPVDTWLRLSPLTEDLEEKPGGELLNCEILSTLQTLESMALFHSYRLESFLKSRWGAIKIQIPRPHPRPIKSFSESWAQISGFPKPSEESVKV